MSALSSTAAPEGLVWLAARFDRHLLRSRSKRYRVDANELAAVAQKARGPPSGPGASLQGVGTSASPMPKPPCELLPESVALA